MNDFFTMGSDPIVFHHQICIRAQKVIDTFLRHVESVELKGA